MLLIILPGHIDLSCGSGVGLLGGVAAVLVIEQNLPAPVAMLAAFVLALVGWTGMGALVVYEKIPAFIITLGGLLVFKGAHWLVIHNATIPVVAGGSENIYSLLTTWYLPKVVGYGLAALVAAALVWGQFASRRRRRAFGFELESQTLFFVRIAALVAGTFGFVVIANAYKGLPLSALILGAVALGVWVLTQHTRFGRHLYAIGGNEEAAFVSGIPVKRVVLGAFALMGGIVAVTGFLQTAYAGYSTTTVGQLMELDAVAACVIGGVSLKGGRGTVGGVIFGSLIMAALLNGMTLLAVSPEIKFIARGLVLAAAVWMDVRFGKRN
jgi:D-xylose transport system permease protein